MFAYLGSSLAKTPPVRTMSLMLCRRDAELASNEQPHNSGSNAVTETVRPRSYNAWSCPSSQNMSLLSQMSTLRDMTLQQVDGIISDSHHQCETACDLETAPDRAQLNKHPEQWQEIFVKMVPHPNGEGYVAVKPLPVQGNT